MVNLQIGSWWSTKFPNWWSAGLSIRILIFFFIYISDLGQEFISDVKLFADDFSCAKAFASALSNDLLKLHN